MHSLHSAHIFIVCNSVKTHSTHSTHSIFDYGHIVLNYTAHIVYSPLNSYVDIHLILGFKYILLLLSLILAVFMTDFSSISLHKE